MTVDPMTVDEALDLTHRFVPRDLDSWRNEALFTLAAEVKRLREEGSAVYNEGYRQGREDGATAPNRLGLASTRELLEELRARGEAYRGPGYRLVISATTLLQELPDALLDYRTVGT